MSLEKCVFVVIGITSRRSRGGKPTPSHKAEGSSAGGASTTKGAGLRPKAKALEEPPDPTVRASLQDTTVVDRSGACIPRGSSGTCESWLFPMWRKTGRVRVPVDQEPWRWQAVPVSQRAPRGDTQKKTKGQHGYRYGERGAKPPRWAAGGRSGALYRGVANCHPGRWGTEAQGTH